MAIRQATPGKNQTVDSVLFGQDVSNSIYAPITLVDNGDGTYSIQVQSAISSYTYAKTTAYAASLVVKASSGTFYGLVGYNSSTSSQFIQVHDAASLPSDGSVPALMLKVEALSNFALDLGAHGVDMSNGIVVCNSSTGPTKTIGTTDCWFVVAYA